MTLIILIYTKASFTSENSNLVTISLPLFFKKAARLRKHLAFAGSEEGAHPEERDIDNLTIPSSLRKKTNLKAIEGKQ